MTITIADFEKTHGNLAQPIVGLIASFKLFKLLIDRLTEQRNKEFFEKQLNASIELADELIKIPDLSQIKVDEITFDIQLLIQSNVVTSAILLKGETLQDDTYQQYMKLIQQAAPLANNNLGQLFEAVTQKLTPNITKYEDIYNECQKSENKWAKIAFGLLIFATVISLATLLTVSVFAAPSIVILGTAIALGATLITTSSLAQFFVGPVNSNEESIRRKYCFFKENNKTLQAHYKTRKFMEEYQQIKIKP